jgi:thiol-disulfide isomerase/thioredoxin
VVATSPGRTTPPRRQAPVQSRNRLRWFVAGATVLLVTAIIAFSLRGGASPTADTTGAFGEVTETSLGGGVAAPGILPVGSRAPDLEWTRGGQRESIASFRGSPVVLEFLATWCSHCQAETPVLSRLHERYADRGVRVVGVTASSQGQDQRSAATMDDLRSFATNYGASFPLIFDRAIVGGRRYGIRSFPTLYVIGPDGVIRFAQAGEVPEQTLVQEIEAALRG